MPLMLSSSPSSNTGSAGTSASSTSSQGKSQGPKKPPVVHNTGSRTYDDMRRSEWNGAKWK